LLTPNNALVGLYVCFDLGLEPVGLFTFLWNTQRKQSKRVGVMHL